MRKNGFVRCLQVLGASSVMAACSGSEESAPGGDGEGGGGGVAPASGTLEWAAAIDGARARSVAVDGQGNVYVAGLFGPRVTCGGLTADAGAGSNLFVLALDRNGLPSWLHGLRNVGTSDESDRDVCGLTILCPAIAVAPDGTLYVGGTTEALDAYLIRLDASSGGVVAETDYAAPDFQSLVDMAIGPDGTLVWVGETESTLTVGGTTLNPNADTIHGVVVALGSDGTPSWGYDLGALVHPTAVARTPDAATHVVGRFDFSNDLGGGPLGGSGASSSHAFLLSLHASGTHAESRVLTSGDSIVRVDLADDSGGALAAIGQDFLGLDGTLGFAMRRPPGSSDWTELPIGSEPFSVVALPDAVIVGSRTTNVGTLTKLDLSGSVSWDVSLQAGPRWDDAAIPRGMAGDASGSLAVVGPLMSSLEIAGQPIVAGNGSYVLRIVE